MHPIDRYLITGASGAIGSAIVPVLMEQESVEIFVLLRAGSAQELEQRHKQLLKFWEIASDSDAAQRITPIMGDVTAANLGMDNDTASRLFDQCTHVIHCAANVRMNLSLEEARRVAVDSTRQLITFAEKCSHLAKCEFVSTVGVGGKLRTIIPEEWIMEERAFHNTYEASKAEAELLIRKQIKAGMPITVHRPSMVVGRATDGRIIHFQIFYHLCEFLSGKRTAGIFPSFGEATLDTVPVDYVARAIVWSSRQTSTVGKILHECSGPDLAIPLVELRALVRELLKQRGQFLTPLVTLDRTTFARILGALSLFTPAKTKRALKTLPIYLEYLAARQRFGNAGSKPILESAGIRLPVPQSYLPIVIDHFLDRR